jgi:hypothetical protein
MSEYIRLMSATEVDKIDNKLSKMIDGMTNDLNAFILKSNGRVDMLNIKIEAYNSKLKEDHQNLLMEVLKDRKINEEKEKQIYKNVLFAYLFICLTRFIIMMFI